jgi:hypothetical protein
LPGSLARQPCPAALPSSLALQSSLAALQKYYKFNNACKIASFFMAVGSTAALHTFTDLRRAI